MKHNWNRTERLNGIKWKQNMQHYSFGTVSFCSCWVKPNNFFPCLLKISRLLNSTITGTQKIHFSLQVQALICLLLLGFGHWSRNLWCVLKKTAGSHLCQKPMNIELILVLQLRLEFGRISQWKALLLCLCFVSSAHFCCSCLKSEMNCVTRECTWGVCMKYQAKYRDTAVPLSSMPCISSIDNLHVY